MHRFHEMLHTFLMGGIRILQLYHKVHMISGSLNHKGISDNIILIVLVENIMQCILTLRSLSTTKYKMLYLRPCILR